MINSAVALAFTSGMVAAFNPCGFSLLPAYIGAFVLGDDVAEPSDRRVIRALVVAAAVSFGFVVVFSTIGLVIDLIADGIQRQLPWVTIVVGGALAVAGVATVAGWRPRVGLTMPQVVTGPRNNALVMVGYGITYAVASLSCTIGPFLAVTGAALTASAWSAAGVYLAYALGMGVVILVISLASALAHTTVATHMRRWSRLAPRIAGVLMVLAGLYAVWYGRWELAVYGGDLGRDPVIGRVEDIRLWIVAEITRVGAVRLAVVTVVATAAVVWMARLHRPARSAAGPRAGDDECGAEHRSVDARSQTRG